METTKGNYHIFFERRLFVENYRTMETDFVDLAELQDLSMYTPQSNAAQSLYALYIEIGKTPLEAMQEVLSVVVGKK